MRLWRSLVSCALAAAVLSACSSGTDKPPYPGIKIGKPYQIYGRWYKPKYESDYDEIGMASWYGPGFHGGKTASGERFDQSDLTAAHRTLPLPSIVRVTNLNTGQSALIKVNDRGPFSRNRILDLSKGSATALGVIGPGTAKVRVQFLEKETKEYVENSNSNGIRYAMNKVLAVDPSVASSTQEQGTKPTFYVMKVPVDQAPPPDSVQVSERDAEKYPTRNIFEAVDHEPAAKEDKSREVASRDTSGRYVSYLDEHATTYNRREEVVDASYISATRPGALAQLSALYYVQAGTFGVEENARRLAERIGGDSKVVNSASGGRNHYRVLVGPYREASAAKNMLSKLPSLGIPSGRIVRE